MIPTTMELVSSLTSPPQSSTQIDLRKHLSPSMLNTFLQCPKKFQYLSLGYKQYLVDDTPIRLGEMLHSVVETFYHKIPVDPSPAKILQVANLCLENNWLHIFTTKQRTIKKALANFVQFERWRLTESKKDKINYKSIDETGKLADPLVERDLYSEHFHAIIDWFWIEKKMLIDWKFGKSNTIHKSYKIQLSIEKEVLEYNDFIVNFTGFGFFRKSPLPSRVGTFNPSLIDSYRDQLLNAIQNNSFPRKKSNLCWYCGYYNVCLSSEKGKTLWSKILW